MFNMGINPEEKKEVYGLLGQGFQNVKFMDGGLMSWPFETVESIW